MKGYRTILFNALMGLLGLLGVTGVIEGSDVPDAGMVNSALDNIEAIILFATPIGNAILRYVTTGPIGTKV